MAIIQRPFYWPNGNGGLNIFIWNCACNSGNIPVTVPSDGGDSTVPSSTDSNNLVFTSDSGNSYNNLTFVSDSGANYNNFEYEVRN